MLDQNNWWSFKAVDIDREIYTQTILILKKNGILRLNKWNLLHMYSMGNSALGHKDQGRYLNNCAPTLPLTQQKSTDNKLRLMLVYGKGWVCSCSDTNIDVNKCPQLIHYSL